jgi:hypothetical protein
MREIVRTSCMGKIILSLLLAAVAPALGHAQENSGKSKKESGPPSEIHQMFIDDQADRHGYSRKEHSREEIQKMIERDEQRLKRTREIYYSGGLKTARDYYDASLLFQHSSVPDDYLLAHILSVVAISKGSKDARWLSAAALDRYLQSIKRKQVFGTQYFKNDKQAYIFDEYDQDLLTDAIRKALDVPVKAEQQRDLEKMNAPQQDKGQ